MNVNSNSAIFNFDITVLQSIIRSVCKYIFI